MNLSVYCLPLSKMLTGSFDITVHLLILWPSSSDFVLLRLHIINGNFSDDVLGLVGLLMITTSCSSVPPHSQGFSSMINLNDSDIRLIWLIDDSLATTQYCRLKGVLVVICTS